MSNGFLHVFSDGSLHYDRTMSWFLSGCNNFVCLPYF